MANPLETLKNATADIKQVRELGNSVMASMKEDLMKGAASDMMTQIFGEEMGQNFSAQIGIGETLKVSDHVDTPENIALKKQLHYERSLGRAEQELISRREQELKQELQAMIQEITQVVAETTELAEEVKIAAMQAQTMEGITTYNKFFLIKFVEDIRDSRKKIQSAKVWLQSQNRRVQKKGWLANYKAQGAKYLLSGEHYVVRSAG